MPFYGDKTIEAIWQSAKPVEGYNPNIWRKDFAGAWIRRDFYGLRNKYGWKIDHKKPKSAGGSDSKENLWALHWQNNMSKGNEYPQFKTSITSDGNRNVEKEQIWTLKPQ